MTFWIRFALRSLLRRRRRTGITLAGMAFAIAVLVVLGAIMVGVNDTMIRNAVALGSGDVTIEGQPTEMHEALNRVETWREQAGQLPQVRAALARCKFPALLHAINDVRAVEVRIVQPDLEATLTPIRKCLVSGTDLLKPKDILLGQKLSVELAINPNDNIDLITSSARYQCRIAGIFNTGNDEYDRAVTFISMSAATDFDEPQTSYEIAVFLKPGSDPVKTRKALLQNAFPSEVVSVWREKMPEVAQLIDLNLFSMNIMTIMIVIILAFGVSNTLLVSVMDRSKQFAILKALGTRPLETIFMILSEATAMCLTAGLFGTLLGMGLSLLWSKNGLDLSHYTSHNPHFSVNSVVHPRLTIIMTLAPQALALSTGILSALWPAIIAARRTVSRGMRDL